MQQNNQQLQHEWEICTIVRNIINYIHRSGYFSICKPPGIDAFETGYKGSRQKGWQRRTMRNVRHIHMPKGSEGLVLILPNWDRLPAFEGGSGGPDPPATAWPSGPTCWLNWPCSPHHCEPPRDMPYLLQPERQKICIRKCIMWGQIVTKLTTSWTWASVDGAATRLCVPHWQSQSSTISYKDHISK